MSEASLSTLLAKAYLSPLVDSDAIAKELEKRRLSFDWTDTVSLAWSGECELRDGTKIEIRLLFNHFGLSVTQGLISEIQEVRVMPDEKDIKIFYAQRPPEKAWTGFVTANAQESEASKRVLCDKGLGIIRAVCDGILRVDYAA